MPPLSAISFLGITTPTYDVNPSRFFIQKTMNGLAQGANPNRPEGRDDTHGQNIYCLA